MVSVEGSVEAAVAAGEAANSGSRESLGNPRNKKGLEQGGGGAGRVEGEAWGEGRTHGHHVPIQLI